VHLSVWGDWVKKGMPKDITFQGGMDESWGPGDRGERDSFGGGALMTLSVRGLECLLRLIRERRKLPVYSRKLIRCSITRIKSRTKISSQKTRTYPSDTYHWVKVRVLRVLMRQVRGGADFLGGRFQRAEKND